MKASEMGKILTTAFVAWPSFVVTEQMARLWVDLFSDIEQGAFWEAMKAALKTNTGNFPPTPGQVHETLARMRTADETTEGEAWGLLMSAVARFGSYQPAEARRWLLNQGADRVVDAVRCLGWREICSWQLSDEPANRAHFWRTYTAFRVRSEFKERVGEKALEAVAPRVIAITSDVVKRLEAK